jgi:hypothetical protein
MAASISESTDYSVRVISLLLNRTHTWLLVLGHSKLVLCHVEKSGVGIGPASPRAVQERVVLVNRLQHVCRSLATDGPHQPECSCRAREQKEILAHVRLQILTAQSTYLEKVNFTVAPPTFSVSGVGLPLDSLRPDNVTYSAVFFVAMVIIV